MNKIEFNQIMKKFKINSIILNAGEKLYSLNDLLINFDGFENAIIYGINSNNIKEIIQKKYPDYYLKESNNSKFISIDNKEIFCFVLYNLINPKKQNFNKIMAGIDLEIIKIADLSISNFDWLKFDELSYNQLIKTLKYDTRTLFGQKLRDTIAEFDECINPFLNKDFKLDKKGDYNSNFDFNVLAYNSKKKKECCFRLEVQDLKSKNNIYYSRDDDGFLYKVLYEIEDGQCFIAHYYSNIEIAENGEFITICYFDKNGKEKLELEYNLTEGTIGQCFGKKSPINQEQKEFIYNELLKAVDLIKLHFLNKLQNNNKNLVLKKNK